MMLEPGQYEEGAAFAFRAALEHCTESGNDWGCMGYHALWQYLRFTGIQPSISRDRGALVKLLHEALVGVEAPHVLISGAADYGLLELLSQWSQVTETSVTVDIVDRCITPLKANQWFADKAGMKLNCYHSDIRDFAPTSSYDLVATHSFIAMFSLSERQALFDIWAKIVRPSGHLLTTTRVYKVDQSLKRRRLDVGESKNKLKQLLEGLHRESWQPPCADSELLHLLRGVYLYRPANEIVVERQLFEMLQTSGFSVSHSVSEEAAAPGVDSLGGSPEGLLLSERITLLATKM